jgi:hypothetical protein
MLALRYPAQTPGLCQSIGGLDRGTPDQFVPGHTRHHSTVTIAFLWQGRARCHWHRPSYLAGFVCPGNPGPPSYVSLHQLDGGRIMSAWLSPHTPTRGVPLICYRHRVLRRGVWSLALTPRFTCGCATHSAIATASCDAGCGPLALTRTPACGCATNSATANTSCDAVCGLGSHLALQRAGVPLIPPSPRVLRRGVWSPGSPPALQRGACH